MLATLLVEVIVGETPVEDLFKETLVLKWSHEDETVEIRDLSFFVGTLKIFLENEDSILEKLSVDSNLGSLQNVDHFCILKCLFVF